MNKQTAVLLAKRIFTDKKERTQLIQPVRQWMLGRKDAYYIDQAETLLVLPLGGPEILELDVVMLSLRIKTVF